jgi:CRP/FNR family cyclic AMP-dependent transcriptional regulator
MLSLFNIIHLLSYNAMTNERVRPGEKKIGTQAYPLAVAEHPLAQALYARGAREVGFGKNETVFDQGDAAEKLHLVTSGRVAVKKRAEDGRLLTLALAGPGDIIWDGLTHAGVHSTTALVEKVGSVMPFSSSVAEQLIVNGDDLSRLISRSLIDTLAEAEQSQDMMKHGDIPHRVARAVWKYSPYARREVTPRGDIWHLGGIATQDEIAQAAGTTREEVNKIGLGFLEDESITTKGARGDVKIINVEGLAELAHTHIGKFN